MTASALACTRTRRVYAKRSACLFGFGTTDVVDSASGSNDMAPRETPHRSLVEMTLTATEAEVAHLAMRGMTTKDIANMLSRAPSTVDFHRNNIRGKLGLGRRVNLRAYLLSIR